MKGELLAAFASVAGGPRRPGRRPDRCRPGVLRRPGPARAAAARRGAARRRAARALQPDHPRDAGAWTSRSSRRDQRRGRRRRGVARVRLRPADRGRGRAFVLAFGRIGLVPGQRRDVVPAAARRGGEGGRARAPRRPGRPRRRCAIGLVTRVVPAERLDGRGARAGRAARGRGAARDRADEARARALADDRPRRGARVRGAAPGHRRRTADHAEGIAAFLEKRPPRFSGLAERPRLPPRGRRLMRMTDPLALDPILTRQTADPDRGGPAAQRRGLTTRGSSVRRAVIGRRQGRGDRLDARRVPDRRPALRRDARQQRADGRPPRARVAHARADAAPEARPDGQGPGRGRARPAAVPRRRGPRQAARGDVRRPARRQDEVPQRLPLPDRRLGRRRDHRVARGRRRDRRPAGPARLELRAVRPDDAQDLLGGIGPHHARPRRRRDDGRPGRRPSARRSRTRSTAGGGR